MLSAAVKGDHDHATRMAATEEDDVRFFSRAFTYIILGCMHTSFMVAPEDMIFLYIYTYTYTHTYINIRTYIDVGCMRTSFMVALEKSVVIESPPFAYI